MVRTGRIQPEPHGACVAAILASSFPMFPISLALAGPPNLAPRTPAPRPRPFRYQSNVTAEGAAQQRRESAEAVTVHSTDRARQQSADLGEVLNRVQGVSIARTGGLGAEVRFALNGLANEQIRFFLNGLPLEVAGFAFNLASIPVNLIDRIEIYRGVVPIRFGADALGGAVNLISPATYYRAGASASLQVGSFSTARGSAAVHYRHDKTGLFLAATGFLDATRNDYLVDVQVPDERGRLYEVAVPRFHDAYAARGVIVDAGVVDRPWARRIVLRGFYSHYDKELQHNPPMTVPFGAARYDESLLGASLHAAQPNALGRGVDVDVVASYSRRTTNFTDTSSDIYDWFGKIIFKRLDPGELSGSPHDITIWRDSIFGRLGVEGRLLPGHAVRASASASAVSSHGVSRAGILPGARDPLAPVRTLLKAVGGVEYEANLFDDRVQNVAFVKYYYLHAASAELLTGAVFVPVQIDDQSGGAGDGLRVRILGQRLYAKASYEYATRQPSQAEVFGDGILVSPNGTLVPERSHNGNLGLSLDVRDTPVGSFDGEVNGFLRASENLIVLLGNLRNFAYGNVFSARASGVEGAVRWRSPRDWLAVQISATYQDIRNTADSGAYAGYRGDRIPNLPWLFTAASVRAQHRGLLRRGDEVALTGFVRYVHDFYRDWESIGAPQYKQVVEAQVSLSCSLTYAIASPRSTRASFALDIDNITNARLYDVYGVQRPGRAFYGKTTLAF